MHLGMFKHALVHTVDMYFAQKFPCLLLVVYVFCVNSYVLTKGSLFCLLVYCLVYST